MHDHQRNKADLFLRLHHADELLVLLNAWDVASARVFEAAGAHAIGTTSMGIAASAGLPDVQTIPLDTMLGAIERIAKSVNTPVSADMEAGYGTTPEQVASSIARALDAGAVGVNIEDGTGNPQNPLAPATETAERIRAVRAMAEARGIHLVINARTDVYLVKAGGDSRRLASAVERSNLYREAGADCAFVPGGLDRDTIAALVREIDAPLNVVANPAISIPMIPPVPELQDLGVKRVSVGAGLMRATLAYTQRASAEILASGTYRALQAELDAPGAPGAYRAAIGAPPT